MLKGYNHHHHLDFILSFFILSLCLFVVCLFVCSNLLFNNVGKNHIHSFIYSFNQSITTLASTSYWPPIATASTTAATQPLVSQALVSHPNAVLQVPLGGALHCKNQSRTEPLCRIDPRSNRVDQRAVCTLGSSGDGLLVRNLEGGL